MRAAQGAAERPWSAVRAYREATSGSEEAAPQGCGGGAGARKSAGDGTLTGAGGPARGRRMQENGCLGGGRTLAGPRKAFSLLGKASCFRDASLHLRSRRPRASDTRERCWAILPPCRRKPRQPLKAFPGPSGSGGLSRPGEAPCLALARTFPLGKDLFSLSPTGEEVFNHCVSGTRGSHSCGVPRDIRKAACCCPSGGRDRLRESRSQDGR